MLKKSAFAMFLLPLFLSAGIFDWFENVSPKVERARILLEGLEGQINQALTDYQVPGIAVGIVVDGQVVFAKGFGFRDIEAQLPVDNKTIFPIGSCTKAFSAFAMGTLVDQGKAKWDQPVIDILPEFRLCDQYATSNVTMRDLLTHRSGMPRHEFVWYNSKMTKTELLSRLRYLEPSVVIRERYQYGQLMYFTAGLAMERAAGKTWEDLVAEKIFNPLQMTSSSFSIEEMQKNGNYASPYMEKQDRLKKMPLLNMSLIGAAGAINSNLNDMMHWVQMQLAGGVYGGQTLISPTTLKEMHSAQVIVPGTPETKETAFCAYGIGWLIFSYRGHYFVSHDGISNGCTSVVGLLPEENIGVVILSNKNMNTLPRYLCFEIFDRLLELPKRSWFQDGVETIRKAKLAVKENKAAEDVLRKKGTQSSHPLEEYVGIYEHPGYGSVAIDLVDGKLEANYNDLKFLLDHWHYDVFSVIEEKQDMIISFEGTKFTFCNNANGDIGELLIPFEQAASSIRFKKKPNSKHTCLSYLKPFTGLYEIHGYIIEIAIRDHGLIGIVPGQADYELIPVGDNKFTIKSMMGSSIRFVMNEDNKVQQVLLAHPYGAFSATPKI